jgi:hypothetical protein
MTMIINVMIILIMMIMVVVMTMTVMMSTTQHKSLHLASVQNKQNSVF